MLKNVSVKILLFNFCFLRFSFKLYFESIEDIILLLALNVLEEIDIVKKGKKIAKRRKRIVKKR